MTRLLSLPLSAILLLSITTGCKPDCETNVVGSMGPGPESGAVEVIELGPFVFDRYTVDKGACGSAWATIGDVDDDGSLEIVASRYGKSGSPLQVPRGEVVIYKQQEDVFGPWTRTAVATQDDDLIFPAATSLKDMDGDGDKDAILPTGWFLCEVVPGLSSCGGLLWFEQTETEWVRHDILPAEQELFFHSALLTDLNGDGFEDLISVGERIETSFVEGAAEVRWWPGLESGGFDTQWHTIGDGLGTKPRLGDVDGDGDIDIYGSQYFLPGASFAWYEQVSKPTGADDPGEWAYHVIDDSVGGAIDLQVVPNLLGDGRTFAIGSNHTNPEENPEEPPAAVYLYEQPEDPTQAWARTRLSGPINARPGRGSLAPGVLGVSDLDGDSDLDIVVSGDGDERVFIYEQQESGFIEHVLEEVLGQAGGMKFADFDGDGRDELLLTGYEADAIYLYSPR